MYVAQGESESRGQLKKSGWQPFGDGLWKKGGEFRTAEDALREKEDQERPSEPSDEFFETLRSAHADHPIFSDPVQTKRLRDLLRDAQAAQATNRVENARLRQESPDHEYLDEPDEWNRERHL